MFVRAGDADVLAIDLPWSAARGRTAIARRAPTGVDVVVVAGDDELVQHITEHAAHGARVLLDVPLDGCTRLSAARPRRAVDDGLARCGIPILPSVKAGLRGPELRARLRAVRRDLRFHEIYPYAVLRALWAVRTSGAFSFERDARVLDLSATWRAYPPKYKRERELQARRRAVRQVAALLASIPGFASAVRTIARATHAQLDRLCDEYDALLGLVAGIAAADRSPWSWLARGEGSILTIADGSLRRRFATARRGGRSS